MKRRPTRKSAVSPPEGSSPKRVRPAMRQTRQRAGAGKFAEVLDLIAAARLRAHRAVNTELVGLYWELGSYISRKIASAEWGDGVVD